MEFTLISVQYCWGEGRVCYCDEKGSVRSVPISWTDKREPDLFVEQSAGRSIMHIGDITGLRQLMGSLWEQHGKRRETNEPI